MQQVRTPAPFPPPDEELCENFGRTMFYAQKLEKEFKLFLLTTEALGKIKIDKKDFKDVESFLLNNKSQNLGKLIKILQSGNGLSDEKLKTLLCNGLQDRNKLAHSLFANASEPKTRFAERAWKNTAFCWKCFFGDTRISKSCRRRNWNYRRTNSGKVR
jgi:hypothetical protein